MTCLCRLTVVDNSPKPLHNRPLTALIEITPLKTLIFSVCFYFFQRVTQFWSRAALFWTRLSFFWTRIVSPLVDTDRDCRAASEKGCACARAGGSIPPAVPGSHASPPSSRISLAAAATPQAHLKEGNPAFQSMQSSPHPTPPENTSTGKGSAGKRRQTLQSRPLHQEWLWERSSGDAMIPAKGEPYPYLKQLAHTHWPQNPSESKNRSWPCGRPSFCVKRRHAAGLRDGSAVTQGEGLALRICSSFPPPPMLVTIEAFTCGIRTRNWNWKQEASGPLEENFRVARTQQLSPSFLSNCTDLSTLFFTKGIY